MFKRDMNLFTTSIEVMNPDIHVYVPAFKSVLNTVDNLVKIGII